VQFAVARHCTHAFVVVSQYGFCPPQSVSAKQATHWFVARLQCDVGPDDLKRLDVIHHLLEALRDPLASSKLIEHRVSRIPVLSARMIRFGRRGHPGRTVNTLANALALVGNRGLETVLRLYAKGKFDTTYAFYVRTQTYRGAPHGDVTVSDRGQWTVLRGDAADPDATVYQLNPDDEQHSEALLVQDKGAALEELDRDLKPIETTMNVTLKRVP